MESLKIAVVGAGLIGKTHMALLQSSPTADLAAIVDPDPEVRVLAETLKTPWYFGLADLLADDAVDGVILSTPNDLHVEQAMLCLEAGMPALIEKPLSHSRAEGERLCSAAETSGIDMLVGHHRMHSPIIGAARRVIEAGDLGDLVAISGSALFFKPDEYFTNGEWRTRAGGGPILINMIHEVGVLRFLCGEIVAVQAIFSNARRGYEVEDSVGMIFSFDNGAIGTFVLSDTAASARSWEQTAQENEQYAAYPDEDCYHIAGTDGSLSIPTMRLKRYPRKSDRSWWKPFDCSVLSRERQDPLEAQLAHFCQVIRGEERPLVSVRDGMQNLRVTEAIVEAARSGCTVRIDV